MTPIADGRERSWLAFSRIEAALSVDGLGHFVHDFAPEKLRMAIWACLMVAISSGTVVPPLS